MTLQPLRSEFTQIRGKFYFLFYQCTATRTLLQPKFQGDWGPLLFQSLPSLWFLNVVSRDSENFGKYVGKSPSRSHSYSFRIMYCILVQLFPNTDLNKFQVNSSCIYRARYIFTFISYLFYLVFQLSYFNMFYSRLTVPLDKVFVIKPIAN